MCLRLMIAKHGIITIAYRYQVSMQYKMKTEKKYQLINVLRVCTAHTFPCWYALRM